MAIGFVRTFGVLLAGATAAGVIAAPAPAQAAEEVGPSLTISSHDIVLGSSITVRGVLRDAAGQPVPAADVVLDQRTSSATAWAQAAEGISDATGAVAITLAPPRSLELRLRTTTEPLVESPVGTVIVRHRISQRFAATSLLLADRLVVTGSIAPARPGARVLLQRRVDGVWRTAAETSAWSDSRYKVWLDVMSPIDRAWRIVVEPAGGLGRAAGAATTVAVRPVPNFEVRSVSRSDVRYSWRSGCPVPYTDLRAVTMNHRTFSGTYARGTLIVHRRVVEDVKAAFGKAFAAGFPIRSIIPIDRYYDGGRRDGVQADIASMNADNTSAFNCRAVVGNPGRLSAHSWGDAVDINPWENPYVTGGKVFPHGSNTYLDRSNRRPGMLFADSAVIKEFTRRGWTWWGPMRDYHHMSRSGG
jgi:hypothetical protein